MRRREPRLLLSFGILAFVAVAAFGIALGSTLQTIIERRARENAAQATRFAARVGIRPYVSREDLRSGMPPARRALLDRLIADRLLGPDVTGIRIWGPDGRPAYASGATGAPAAATRETVRRALRGDSHVGYERRASARALVVYLPILHDAAGRAGGALELVLATDSIDRQVATDVQVLRILLAGGLALLYGLLFSIVVHASRRLRDQASRDALTELANRRVFYDRLESAVASGPTGVLIVDLDGFKAINDGRGHAAGDEVLRLVATRLAGAVRAGDTLARLGGDEFGVVAPGVDAAEAERLAERLLAALDEPIALDGVIVNVRASVGAAVAPRGADPDDLPRLADAAMYRAKATGGGLALSA
jgi:diguanylate cyclase (GGDEF)-like protein